MESLEMSTRDTLVEGKSVRLDALVVDGKEIVITGTFARTGRIEDEWYEDVIDPERLVAKIRESGAKMDIFSFWQRLPDTTPKFDYYFELDSVAALPVDTAEHWRKTQLNPKSRNLLRKSEKSGVVVREAKFDDEFLRGMSNIFNETPVRQDKPFWHYKKGIETIRQEFSRYLSREDLFGAYYNNELIGFIFLAYAGRYALLGQILSKIEHRDKATNNALIAKAVEVCDQKRIPYLVYATWAEGSLGHFKRQNGFEKFDLPRYYVPLTLKGRLCLRLRLHHGLVGIMPARLKDHLIVMRNRWYSRKSKNAAIGK
jgi:hypothetical protein